MTLIYWPLTRITCVSQHQNVSMLDFTRAKDDGSGGVNWSSKTCKDPVKSSPPTNQHPAFYRTDSPHRCPMNSVKALKDSMDLLTPSSSGVFHPCLWPLKAPVTLGEGCQASRQPSDTSNPLGTGITTFITAVKKCTRPHISEHIYYPPRQPTCISYHLIAATRHVWPQLRGSSIMWCASLHTELPLLFTVVCLITDYQQAESTSTYSGWLHTMTLPIPVLSGHHKEQFWWIITCQTQHQTLKLQQERRPCMQLRQIQQGSPSHRPS